MLFSDLDRAARKGISGESHQLNKEEESKTHELADKALMFKFFMIIFFVIIVLAVPVLRLYFAI